MERLPNWVRDPRIHMILFGIALVYGVMGSRDDETLHASAATPSDLSAESDDVIVDVSPPITAGTHVIVRED